jgi:hypothetical protein
MNKKLIAFLGVAACLLVAVIPAVAHHGRGATYDMKKEVQLKGTVAEVLWRNPHIAIFIDVKDESGTVTRWAIEHSNIVTLTQQGYGRATLKAGQEVTAFVRPGAKGEPIGLCMKIVFPDGKQIFDRNPGVD